MSSSVDLVEFRNRCDRWFAERYEPLDPERHDVPGLIAHTTDDHDAPMREARRHQRALWDSGLAGLTVERRYGGKGLPPEAEMILAEVAGAYMVPSMVPLSVGLSLALSTLVQFGSEETCAAR
ncbi:MAG: hypothetical protein F2772_07570, partial [Actinobacteria bacterium]|nr:hypothetical protein [Actinomycetota bacterium]